MTQHVVLLPLIIFHVLAARLPGPPRFLNAETEDLACSVAFSPDGKTLAIGFHESIQLWETAIWKRRAVIPYPGTHLAFASDGRALAATSSGRALAEPSVNDEVLVLNLQNEQVRARCAPLRGQINALAISPNGRTVAIGDERGFGLWDTRSPTATVASPANTKRIEAVAFAPDGKQIATGDSRGQIALWATDRPRMLRIVGKHNNYVNSLAFSADGSLLFSGGQDSTVRLWDLASGKQRLRIDINDPKGIFRLALSPDARTIASASTQGIVALWNTNTGQPTFLLRDPDAHARSVAFSPTGDLIAVGVRRGVHIWKIHTRK